MTTLAVVDLFEPVPPSDAVVVIDVLRAFTTAAVALARGAAEILPVASVDEAFAQRRRDASVVLLGEVDGHPIPGFDHGNSPVELAAADVAGRRLVQRTSSGTQGLLGHRGAGSVLAASFACASATVALLRERDVSTVCFVVTGSRSPDHGEEDRACADHLAALLRGDDPDPEQALERVRRSVAARRFQPGGDLVDMAADLPLCMAVDLVDFGMEMGMDGALASLRAVVPRVAR